ncbi:MAG: hypothetical protein ACREOY_03335 [Candidatus Dormibacteraceae bacterium]
MNRSLRTGGALVGFGVVLSQLGHLLVYQLQFGPASPVVESTGAHAYFPTLVKTSLGLGAAAVLASLLIICAARFVTGTPRRAIAGGPPYLRLLGALFTVQLVFFALQETIESIAAGTAVAAAPHLLLMGSVGQLPVAIVGALALKWVLVRFESAVTEIRVAFSSVRSPISPVAVAVSVWRHHDLVLRPIAGASLAKRGPPSHVRLGPTNSEA